MERLLTIWPTAADLARDLGLPYTTVASWKARGIPAERARDIVVAAQRRGAALTLEDLIPLPPAAPRPASPEAAA